MSSSSSEEMGDIDGEADCGCAGSGRGEQLVEESDEVCGKWNPAEQ